MEFAPYNKKAFLLPDSINSAAMYHAKIFPDGRYIFRIHDCLTGIRLTGDLKEEQDFIDATEKARQLAKALFDFASHVDDLRYERYDKQATVTSQPVLIRTTATTFEEYERANAPKITQP